ncbi:carboxy-terminal kinesin 2-like [Mizuhopecten yessoensis]|uniref:Kinesin-like protein n=1 Tax=Mizuhopecten yessoensis TaxID=6573 RepID=A0A210QP75_MIZYE|nr:carboxy-terminal kinesin 2-like [Mizuhopecten yessoensis]OWF50540.1 Carboxy-terminal kinesin 2 [Mizuhopecten yessoensis]
MSQLKRPLATLNGTGSRLPRLPVPKSSSLRMPVPLKRTRSPDELPSEKRICLENRSSTGSNSSSCSVSSVSSQKSGSNLRSQTSGSSLRSQTSGSNLRANKYVLNKPKAVPVKPQPATRAAPSRTGLTRSNSVVVKSAIKPVVTRTTMVSRGGPPASTRNRTTGSSGQQAQKAPESSVGGGGGKKRQAWDLKGRLQDMELILREQKSSSSDLMMQLQSNNNRIFSLENQNSHLSGTVAQKEQVATAASEEISFLKKQIREEEEKFDGIRRKLQGEISDLTFLKETLDRQKQQLDGEVTAANAEINGLKTTVAQMTSAQAGMSAELEATKVSLEAAMREGRQKDEEIRRLKGVVRSQEETIEDFNAKFREHETARRKLHNTIQELKGNIRVFCRVRPLLGDECLGNNGDVQHMNFPDVDQKVLELEKIGDMAMNESCLAASRRGNKFEFSFDRVFQPSSSQAEVFEEISQLIQSALDGYNVCIFAYGQTGSGKTYTMEGGSVNDPESQGMIPRAVVQIFESIKEMEAKGWKYNMEASFLEIYNETIRDLLGNGKDELKHEIKLTGMGSNDVIVTNLTLVTVETDTQITSLLKKASHNRAVAETKCNEHSSRSHSVLRLKLTGENSLSGEACVGTLNLVDLAGSERLKESGSEGQRLKETLSINKSLSTLGNVIMALGNKDNHIPYRNSKLTYLLQNSLGGNSKTLMFVNASPKEECFQETLNSLRFATKVNQCNIGTAQKKSK